MLLRVLAERQVSPTGKTQFAIRRIFEQIDRVPRRALEPLQQLQHGALFLEAGRDPGWILKVADQIKQFDLAQLAAAGERGSLSFFPSPPWESVL